MARNLPNLSPPETPLPPAADSDRLLIHLTAAQHVLTRAYSELRSQSFITAPHAGAVMRSIAVDVETALAQIGRAVNERRGELQ